MSRPLALAALLLVSLALPSAAQAGAPFTVGQGKAPHLLVDPSTGPAHVVWANGPAKKIVYCRVPRGATACQLTRELDADIGGYGPDAPFLLADGGGLRIIVPHYVADVTVAWTSTDGGTTWSGPQQVYKYANTTDHSEPVAGPQPGSFTIAGFNPTLSVYSAALDGSESNAPQHATLTGGGGYDLQVAPTTDGGLVTVGNDLNNLFFWRMAPGADPSDSPSWSGANPVGPGKESRVAGGSSGTFLLSSGGTPAAGKVEVRRWTGGGFGPPVVVANETPYINDIVVGPSGTVAALWRRNDAPHRLQLGLSRNAGATFTTATIAREDVVMASMDVSIASDDRGFAVYEGSGGGATSQIRMASTDPVEGGAPATTAPVPATARRSVSVPGARIDLYVPGACVPAGGRFRVRLTWKRKKRTGNVFVKVTRADFYIGTKVVKRDRRAPFSQILTIANAQPGKSYRLRARAFIKVRRGRAPKKSIFATVKVCT